MWRNILLIFAFFTGYVFLSKYSAAAASAVVFISSSSSSLTFRSVEASFASPFQGSGIGGFVVLGSPAADACSPLKARSDKWAGSSPILLAMQGNCSAETKVRNGQAAGFTAIIICNNESGSSVTSMTGSSDGITIPAVFVTKAAGETLAKYADDATMSVWIFRNDEDTIWSTMVFALIFLVAIAAGVVTWCFVKRNRSRRRSRFKGPCVISSRIVEAMPTDIYKVIGNEKAAQESCTICLEDYIPGEKLRILPCSHRFHASCVDAWLTLWRAVCPMCKRDARYEFPDLQASERTPLLGFAPMWASSSESPPIKIPPSHSDFSNVYLGSSSCSKGGASSSKHYQPPSLENSLNAYRQFTSLQSSLEAFRASPYFTPPSFSYNPSPLLPGYSGAVGSLPRYSYSSSRDIGSKSFLNPKRASCSSPVVGSCSSQSNSSQSTYLNPGKGKNAIDV